MSDKCAYKTTNQGPTSSSGGSTKSMLTINAASGHQMSSSGGTAGRSGGMASGMGLKFINEAAGSK